MERRISRTRLTDLTCLQLGLLCAVLSLTGCRSTSTVASYSELNHKLAGKTVEISLTTGERYLARAFRVDAGTATFMNVMENPGSASRFVEIDADLIQDVVDRRRGKGALQGLGIGALAGAAFGAALGATTTTEDCTGDALCGIGRDGWALLGAVVFTLPGAVVGTLLGASMGARTRYRRADSVVITQ